MLAVVGILMGLVFMAGGIHYYVTAWDFAAYPWWQDALAGLLIIGAVPIGAFGLIALLAFIADGF